MPRKIFRLLFILNIVFLLASCRQQPVGWVMLNTKSNPPNSLGGAIAYMASSGKAVLFGGRTDKKWLDETWIWDGQDWSQDHPANQPPAREKLTMAYDRARNKIVLFGGAMSTTLFDDTWEWDGQDWHLMNPRHRPLARCCHAMAYDSVQKKMIVYGGYDSTRKVFLNDAWAWDGTDWTEVTCCGLPAMSGHAMIDLPDVKEVISVQTSGWGTWVWDGSTWKDAAMESPPARSEGKLAYDTQHDWAVFFGGSQKEQLLNDVWILDGEQWLQLSLADNPPARWGHVIFYDAGRDTIIIFGGVNGEGKILNDTWELNLPDDLSNFVVTAAPQATP
jgi:hypothetical protein